MRTCCIIYRVLSPRLSLFYYFPRLPALLRIGIASDKSPGSTIQNIQPWRVETRYQSHLRIGSCI